MASSDLGITSQNYACLLQATPQPQRTRPTRMQMTAQISSGTGDSGGAVPRWTYWLAVGRRCRRRRTDLDPHASPASSCAIVPRTQHAPQRQHVWCPRCSAWHMPVHAWHSAQQNCKHAYFIELEDDIMNYSLINTAILDFS